jgi:hypothetical protein
LMAWTNPVTFGRTARTSTSACERSVAVAPRSHRRAVPNRQRTRRIADVETRYRPSDSLSPRVWRAALT